MRLCTTCGVEKELEAFHNYKKGPGGKAYRCKACDTAARRAYQARQCPEKAALMARRRKLRSQYGLELEDYDAMVKRSGGVCEICKKEPYSHLCIDHCHTTGKVRGLLCVKCNQALGLFQDNIDNLLGAITYLKERSDIH